MAEPQDIPQPNQEQEAILQRAPYLKAFLSEAPDLGGYWLNRLEPKGKPIDKEISRNLGENWRITTLAPLALMVSEQKVLDTSLFKDSTPDDALFRVNQSLFMIGYEVGNEKDAFNFYMPIFEKLAKSGLLHASTGDDKADDEYSQRLFKTVWGVIKAGNFIRFYSNQLNQPEGTQPQEDPFKNFIQGLEDIDKLPPKNVDS